MTNLRHTTIESAGDVWATRALVASLLPSLTWRRHGIGVLQAYVHESATGRELRVHVWSRRLMLDGIEESGIAHNHRFKLRSTLLAGSLTHTEWQVADGTGFALYDFVHARLHNDENRAAMRRLPGEVSVRMVPVLLHPGCRYTFDRGAYHSSMPASDVVATLAEKLDQVEEKARVVAPASIPPVPAFGGGEPDPRLVRAVLAEAATKLLAVST